MPRAVEVYQCSWDNYEWVVAATSKVHAADLIGMNRHEMKVYGHVCSQRVARAYALSAPGSVWRRRSWFYPWKQVRPEVTLPTRPRKNIRLA
jgi:hypothetical protein